MLVWGFDLAGRLVEWVMLLASLWSDKVRDIIQGRTTTFAKLNQLSYGASRIWFHVSSLGEFEQARPLIEAYRERYPCTQIVLSFFSSSGYQACEDYAQADVVIYLPSDTQRSVRQYLDILRPNIVVFVKYDFWPTMLSELGKREIRTYLVASAFREEQIFFRSWGRWYGELLKVFERIYVQDTASACLLQKIGIQHVQVAGDTRFDRVRQVAASPKHVKVAEWLRSEYPSLLVAGSTWRIDDRLLLEVWAAMDNYGLILVPHELDDSYIDELISHASRSLYRLSDLEELSTEELRILKVEGIVVDCIGLLSSLYQYASVAYIGGGFGKGIHNAMEAAAYGLPILFGPKIDKFREAKDLVACGAAFVVNSEEDILLRLGMLAEDTERRRIIGLRSLAYLERGLGATDIILSGMEGN